VLSDRGEMPARAAFNHVSPYVRMPNQIFSQQCRQEARSQGREYANSHRAGLSAADSPDFDHSMRYFADRAPRVAEETLPGVREVHTTRASDEECRA
jgi:hypothetical protein